MLSLTSSKNDLHTQGGDMLFLLRNLVFCCQNKHRIAAFNILQKVSFFHILSM